ncbi:MAG: type transport system ATP-binding protein, partial [Actinomycetota bacterium]|nr:type transport system ATP-binding protein [Actinomycetota bacterium]
MTSTAPAVSVTRLTKRYGSRAAVDDLTVDIPTGVVAGFIGPNGAGKTTTMAMLLGLVRPSSGTGTILGEPLNRPEAYLGRVGALVEGPAFWTGLTGTENLRVLARLGGHDAGRIAPVLELVGLGSRGGDRFGEYSLGMKQRLGIAGALLGDPDLLVLDEPTNGLDPVGINEMRELIGRVSADDRTVLVSSHILTELEHVCDWLLVIDDGRLVYAGDSDGFIGRATTEIVLAPADVDTVLSLADIVARHGFDAGRAGDELIIAIDGAVARHVAASLNRAAAEAGIVLAELHVRRPTLESHYLRLLEG